MPNQDPYFAAFDFDLARAVLGQLVKAFETLGVAPMTEAEIRAVGELPGVYQLHLQGTLVYVGKADTKLSKRLMDHYWTIRGRKNIAIEDMAFKCLSIHPNWAPLTHESMLIKHYKRGGHCEWNALGVGNHDPGRRREDFQPGEFDLTYPINEMFPCATIQPGEYNVNDLLMQVKANLPYVFRYQVEHSKRWKQGHPDYAGVRVNVAVANMAAEEMLKLIVRSLPGWQATVFLSHMILYKETRTYNHGRTIVP